MGKKVVSCFCLSLHVQSHKEKKSHIIIMHVPRAGKTLSKRRSFAAVWNATPGVTPLGSRRPSFAKNTPFPVRFASTKECYSNAEAQKKLIRDSGGEFLIDPWTKATFFERHQIKFFVAFFLTLWAVIYYTQYQMLLEWEYEWVYDDLTSAEWAEQYASTDRGWDSQAWMDSMPAEPFKPSEEVLKSAAAARAPKSF